MIKATCKLAAMLKSRPRPLIGGWKCSSFISAFPASLEAIRKSTTPTTFHSTFYQCSMPTPSTCPPCDCGDSGLSVAGNVIGVITFVYVLFIGLSYRATTISRAHADIHNMLIEARIRQQVLEQWQWEQEKVPMEQQVSCGSYQVTQEARAVLQPILEAIRRVLNGNQSQWRYLLGLGWTTVVFMKVSGVRRVPPVQPISDLEKVLRDWNETRPIFWLGWRLLRDRQRIREALDRFDTLLGYAKALAETGVRRRKEDEEIEGLREPQRERDEPIIIDDACSPTVTESDGQAKVNSSQQHPNQSRSGGTTNLSIQQGGKEQLTVASPKIHDTV